MSLLKAYLLVVETDIWYFDEYEQAEAMAHKLDIPAENIKTLEEVTGRVLYGSEQFMAYFRSDAYNLELTEEQKREVFLMSLTGASDITRDLLERLCKDYCVDLDFIVNGAKDETGN